MRFVIFGAGAIGGLVGTRLHQSGHEVLLIARGAHHDAIARDGLTLLTPSERETVRIPVARDPASAVLREDDVILLCVKSQDTAGALLDLRDAAPSPALPVVCMQNGVENERIAQRLFSNAYGAVLLIPAEHLEPGVVAGYGSDYTGRIDIGRLPAGADALCQQLTAAFVASDFEADARAEIMVHKYAKLLGNLSNGVQAICGIGDRAANEVVAARLREEGQTILDAAGIRFESPETIDVRNRWAEMHTGEINGHGHQGGSTWQSVKRGTVDVETDYLNGEVVLLARQLGLPAPINETVQSLTRETLVRGLEPGWLNAAELLARADGRSSDRHP